MHNGKMKQQKQEEEEDRWWFPETLISFLFFYLYFAYSV